MVKFLLHLIAIFSLSVSANAAEIFTTSNGVKVYMEAVMDDDEVIWTGGVNSSGNAEGKGEIKYTIYDIFEEGKVVSKYKYRGTMQDGFFVGEKFELLDLTDPSNNATFWMAGGSPVLIQEGVKTKLRRKYFTVNNKGYNLRQHEISEAEFYRRALKHWGHNLPKDGMFYELKKRYDVGSLSEDISSDDNVDSGDSGVLHQAKSEKSKSNSTAKEKEKSEKPNQKEVAKAQDLGDPAKIKCAGVGYLNQLPNTPFTVHPNGYRDPHTASSNELKMLARAYAENNYWLSQEGKAKAPGALSCLGDRLVKIDSYKRKKKEKPKKEEKPKVETKQEEKTESQSTDAPLSEATCVSFKQAGGGISSDRFKIVNNCGYPVQVQYCEETNILESKCTPLNVPGWGLTNTIEPYGFTFTVLTEEKNPELRIRAYVCDMRDKNKYMCVLPKSSKKSPFRIPVERNK
ncbi:hypothetical protein ACLVWU_08385 [Bdellovibrio sp. HCB290]|uniref:hypothetical protein n=1 Tax=Bdellovibrio sp. HCB290 TaxID=3394356 RepID=UPI0039B607F0